MALKRRVDISVLGESQGSGVASLLRNVARAAIQADIVHVQYVPGLYGYMGLNTPALYSVLAHVGHPVVTTIHELPPWPPLTIKERLAAPYLRLLFRYVLRHSHATIVHSQSNNELLQKWGIKQTVQVIPHGVVNTIVRAPRNRNSIPTLGFFGFISENKGLHHVIDALSELPGVRLRIAGAPRSLSERDQAYYAGLREQAVGLGVSDRIEFLGFVPDEHMAEFFASVDIILFPYALSTASGALSLALAHDTVALTSDLPMFKELKAKYDCLETFKLNIPGDLVAQLSRLLSDRDRCEQLLAGARRLVEDVGWDSIADRTINLYDSLCYDKLNRQISAAKHTAR